MELSLGGENVSDTTWAFIHDILVLYPWLFKKKWTVSFCDSFSVHVLDSKKRR